MNRCGKLAALGLTVVLSAGLVLPVMAEDTEVEVTSLSAGIEAAENEKAEMEQDLDEVRGTIDDLEDQKQTLTGEIDGLQGDLVRTISSIESLNRDVDQLSLQMEQTTADLDAAEEDRSVQYEAMKKRIQYLYEEGGESGWVSVFLGGESLSDILDKAEYTQQMYNYDRNQLEEYLEVINLVESLQRQQYEDISALETRKHEQEEAQTRLEGLISEAKDKYDDFDERLAEAYTMAEEYQSLIEEQNEAIALLIAMQEAMRAQEEAAAAAAAQQIVQQYYQDNGGYDQTAYQADYQADYDYQADDGQTADVSRGTYTGGNAISQSSYTSATGQAILAYAQQFLGNPYVYGGNSLTDGVDCSGFVQQVMANFGISTQRTSWGQETDGQAVSYNDVQVGDLIIYDGHSAIYAGDNQVINAIDEAHGIGYSEVDSGQIVAIRRLVEEDVPADTYTETYTESYSEAPADTYVDTSAVSGEAAG